MSQSHAFIWLVLIASATGCQRPQVHVPSNQGDAKPAPNRSDPVQVDEVAQAESAKLKALLDERQLLLAEAFGILLDQYEKGLVDFSRLVHTERQLLVNALQRHEEPGKRTKVLQGLEQSAKKLLADAESRFKGGRSTQLDTRQAKSALLDIQVELLRASTMAGNPQPELQAMLKDLVDQRQEAYAEWFKISLAQYQGGLVHITSLLQVEEELLRLALELTAENRVAALRELEQKANSALLVAEVRFQGGLNSQLDAQLAKIVHLDAQISLWDESLKSQAKNPTKAKLDQRRALLDERQRTLAAAKRVVVAQYQGALVDIGSCFLINCMTSPHDPPAQRLAALQELETEAKELVKIMRARFEKGLITKDAVPLAEATLLGIQISILREEMKAKAQKLESLK